MSRSYFVRMHEPSEDLYLMAYNEADELVAASRIDVKEVREYFEQPGSPLTHDLLDSARSLEGEETVAWARQEPESAWSDTLGPDDVARMAE